MEFCMDDNQVKEEYNRTEKQEVYALITISVNNLTNS